MDRTSDRSDTRFGKLLPLILLLLAAGAMVRCDNSLEPLDSQRGFYSIYGLLDLDSESNFIRVKDLNQPLLADSTRELDVTVRFQNLDTGEEEILEDSVVRFEDVYTHNFHVTRDIRPGDTYRVTAEGPEGGESHAVATTPQFVDVGVPPPTVNCSTWVGVTFDPVLSEENLSVRAGFKYQEDGFFGSQEVKVLSVENPDQKNDSVMHLSFKIQDLLIRASENFNLSSAPECFEMSTDRLFLEYTHHSGDLFGQNESDTTTVPGGAGRFGALYRDTLSFEIDTVRICSSIFCFKPPDDYCQCSYPE